MKQLVFEDELVVRFLDSENAICVLEEIGRVVATETYIWRSNLPYKKMRMCFFARDNTVVVKRIEVSDAMIMVIPEATRKLLKRVAKGNLLMEIENGWRKAKAKGEAKDGKKGTRKGI